MDTAGMFASTGKLSTCSGAGHRTIARWASILDAKCGLQAKFWSSREFVLGSSFCVAAAVVLFVFSKRIFTRICLEALEVADAGTNHGERLSTQHYKVAVMHVYLGINASPLGLLCTMSTPHLQAANATINEDQGVSKLEMSLSHDEFVRRMTTQVFAVWAFRATCFVVAFFTCTPVACLAVEKEQYVPAAVLLAMPFITSSLFKFLYAHGRSFVGFDISFIMTWLWRLQNQFSNHHVRHKDVEYQKRLFHQLDTNGDGALSKEVCTCVLRPAPGNPLQLSNSGC